MDLNLKNKNALVSGSSKGIGKAVALTLAELGANVTLVSRSEEALQSVLRELDNSKGQVHDYLVLDFSDLIQVEAQVSKRLESKGYHIIINNSGGPKAGNLLGDPTQKLVAAFQQHVLASQRLVQMCVPFMKESGYGRILSITSTSVRQPIDGLGVSNVTRAAMASWTKTLSNELAEFGITVNNILPGTTNTQRITNLIEARSKMWDMPEDQVEAKMKSEIPLNRFAEAEEVANVVAFLASPAASYVTGVNMPVDGGKIKCI